MMDGASHDDGCIVEKIIETANVDIPLTSSVNSIDGSIEDSFEDSFINSFNWDLVGLSNFSTNIELTLNTKTFILFFQFNEICIIKH